jgi:hypothetical protein
MTTTGHRWASWDRPVVARLLAKWYGAIHGSGRTGEHFDTAREVACPYNHGANLAAAAFSVQLPARLAARIAPSDAPGAVPPGLEE